LPVARPTSRRAVLRAIGGTIGATAVPRVLGAAEPELRFGLTPVFLTSDLELLQRLKSHLERATGRSVRLITRRTYQEITALLVSGQLDAAWICGYPFVAYRAQLALVAVPVWKGRPLYQSYLIASADRPAARLEDLKSDIHAFSDPDSNSGWLVTAAALAEMGTDAGHFFRQTFFTYGHRNVIRAVASGLAGSGSVDGYVYEVMRETEAELVAATRVVQASAWLGFPPIACPIALADDPATHRLRRALADMVNDEDGRVVLSMLRLDGFEVEEPSLFDPIAAAMWRVRGGSAG
jgi:phosphonate transport system substrate-binding protein